MIGKRLRELRNKRGLSQIELGQRVGVTKSTIYNWETGNCNPSTAHLIAMTRELQCPLENILLDSRKVIKIRKGELDSLIGVLSRTDLCCNKEEDSMRKEILDTQTSHIVFDYAP